MQCLHDIICDYTEYDLQSITIYPGFVLVGSSGIPFFLGPFVSNHRTESLIQLFLQNEEMLT